MGGVVGLGGGIGASRLWRALVPALPAAELTLVVNTADDVWMHTLRICPDLDTTLYTLSGQHDPDRGWGLRDESFRTMGALSGLGREVWFNLGDLDLATHLFRTELLAAGDGLAEITRRLTAALGVATTVLPMTEDEVETQVRTAAHGPLHYQEFLVRHGAGPAVLDVDYLGLDRAAAAPGVLEALDADIVVLAPSNPVASIMPILGLRGVRETLRTTTATVVAISPMVMAVPITDPGEARRAKSRDVLLRACGVEPDPVGVAGLYRDLCHRFVLDTADTARADAIRALGLDVAIVPTLLHAGAPAAGLIKAILGSRIRDPLTT
jgi:LPPG:FO 2-phospho-L-lactate transferase